ncbi:hypothetical protein ACQR16_32600 [Bradyrhizobium oligotrophicum]|uniref:hypothetical protein n=1 Tax=Bradyrhizobium oligotrophicum TaxID=44255 RepID=UPI003EB79662
MIVQIKATCEFDGSVLAATSFDDTDEQARTTAVIALFEQVLAHSENADDQRLFSLDIETLAQKASPLAEV